jgi:hypothetical protein
MADFFDSARQHLTHKDEMEILDKQKHEFKLIGRERKVHGHKMFSFNMRTGEIKVAPVEHSKDVDFRTQQPIFKGRIVVEPDCMYRQALNRKNFVKRLAREGVITDVGHGSRFAI